MILVVDKSEAVTSACTACGGPNLIRYPDTEHGHAFWCPYFNVRTRAMFTKRSSLGPHAPTRTQVNAERIQQRRQDVYELYNDGWSAKDIAALLNVSPWVVRDDLKGML